MPLELDDALADEYYSGTLENLERVLRMVNLEGGRLSNVGEDEVRVYQAEVDRLINRRLSPYYAVPLAKLVDDRWPDPIPFIAARLVAADIIHNEFTEIEANQSAAAQTMKQNALSELDRLTMGFLAGAQRLEGQRFKSRNRFARPSITPLSTPPDPSGGGPLPG